MSDFVSFKLAQKLKEKGFILEKTEIYGKFDSDGLFHPQLYFNYIETMDCDEIIAPTISQVLKWLRDEKKISIEPTIHCFLEWICSIYGFSDRLVDFTQYSNDGIDDTVFIFYDSYEQAALAGIEYTINNLI
jgi:hypothetical protein